MLRHSRVRYCGLRCSPGTQRHILNRTSSFAFVGVPHILRSGMLIHGGVHGRAALEATNTRACGIIQFGEEKFQTTDKRIYRTRETTMKAPHTSETDGFQ